MAGSSKTEHLGLEVLRGLAPGSAVLTWGVVWVKVDDDQWYCPTAALGRNLRPDAWMARVALEVLHDVSAWETEKGYRK